MGIGPIRNQNLIFWPLTNACLVKILAGARTMEIGPIRNQNLIFWPLANVLGKLTRDNKKEKSSALTDNQIYAVPANQFSLSAGTSLDFIKLRRAYTPVNFFKEFCMRIPFFGGSMFPYLDMGYSLWQELERFHRFGSAEAL